MSRSIIGESFKPYVRDQISLRQTKLANRFRDEDTLKYITSKTSWVRLSSGVDIYDDSVLNGVQVRDTSISRTQNITLSGNLLAKAHVLKNFENTEVNSAFVRYGAVWDNASQGVVPLPGIISVDVKSLNKGSLREATVQIVCHSLAQFKIIEALYLKLKYSMLLEWGHSYWYDSNIFKSDNKTVNSTYNVLRSDMPDWVHEGYLDGKFNQDVLLEILEKQRQEFSGNYDAFLGYVKNFTWSIRKDGGYDITLNLISMGDIIESLKLNINYPGSASTKSSTSETISSSEGLPSTIANKSKSSLNQILYAIQQLTNTRGDGVHIHGYNENDLYGLNGAGIIAITKALSNYDLVYYNYANPIEIEKPNEASNILAINEAIAYSFEKLLPLNEDGTPSKHKFSYLKLGALLRIIESFLLKYETSVVKNGSYKPLFYIDHDYDTNLCLTLPQQCSTDPRVCLLRPAPPFYNFTSIRLTGVSIEETLENVDYGYGTYRPLLGSSPTPFIGRFMHIPVNIDYITSVLNDNIDEEGKISLYDFLTKLMKGIQTTIGSINDFEVTYDEVTNHFIIRDNSIIPGAEKLLNREVIISQINANTLKSEAGSFVTDVSIISELNNSFASIISIGAQFNGNKVGENATALSKLNYGFSDRLIPAKSTFIDDNNSNISGSLGVNEQWKQNIIDYGNLIDRIDIGVVTVDDISNNTQSIVDLLKYELGVYTQRNNIAGVGFIPINLRITMDGLSGPRIYEAYSINEDLLPDSYKNNIQFITRGVSHKIDNNGWFTTLESFSGPRPQGVALAPLSIIETTTEKTESTTDISKAEEAFSIEDCSSIPSTSGRNVSSISGKIKIVGKYLMDAGLSKEAAAGAIGSLIVESGLNYQAWNGKGSKTVISGGSATTTITVGSTLGNKLDSYSPLKLTYKGEKIVAYGLPQWTRKRKEKYFAFQQTSGGDSLDTQAKYIVKELLDFYKTSTYDRLIRLNTGDECAIWKATKIFLKYYEGVYTYKGAEERYGFALGAYKYL
jgi:hypothetical protein